MSTEKLIEKGSSSSHSLHCYGELQTKIFEELPKATIVSVSRPDVSDISPLLLSYTIQLHYKQFKWQIEKKASQVIYLHFSLKKRAIIEEFHEKQEQVKEWLQNVGIGDQTAVTHDRDEPDDGAMPVHNEDSVKNRNIPSRAALSIIRPSLGKQQTVSEKAKVAMQGYLNYFLGNLDTVNSKEVCKFLEVSRLSFVPEYGSKLKEDYVTVKHIPKITKDDDISGCCMCSWSGCCDSKWQKVNSGKHLASFLLTSILTYYDLLSPSYLLEESRESEIFNELENNICESSAIFAASVWAVLKPGFLALLKDPFDTKLMDIMIFDVLPSSKGKGDDQIYLADEVKKRYPLRYAFKVSCANRSIELRSTSYAKVKGWVKAINEAGSKPSEGWCHPHRYGSFAPQRGLIEDGSKAQWFVDGKVTFEAIALALESAKSEIYITGWWLCPELYLRRPFHNHSSSRLDALLEAKAKQGVQIYILLYKEVSIALKINSLYSQKKLRNIHENVKVLRYPNHLSTGVYLWSHHEKLVIVDHRICFIGGIDLCFGRYDTTEHKVGDHPSFIWPGKDYYNPRESEPNSWEDVMNDELDRVNLPRMPWHDVHCALWGPPCRDIARHFIQRWNHAKRNKAANEQTIPLLMPQQHMVLPHYMGRSKEIEIENKSNAMKRRDINREDSFSSQSPQDEVPLLLPREADGVLLSNTNFNLKGLIAEDSIIGLEVTGFSDGSEELMVQDDWWERQERGYQVSTDEIAEVGPLTSCKCQVIRSVGQWSAGTSQTEDSIHRAYCSLIEKAQHFIYIENQFFISGLPGDEIIQNRVLDALYKRILLAHTEHKCFRVIVVIPLLPGFQGGLDDGGAATVRALTHWQYRTICRGKDSILHRLNALMGPKMNDYISFYGLRTYGRLCDGGPLVTNQVYVHSKVMIIDDCIALVGSSNINDRSLLGSRDSEICIVIEDKEFVDSSMNGESWKAGKFSSTLRLSLWAEHLGLCAGEINRIRDPIREEIYKDLWMATAKSNAMIYQDVFSCIPNDIIHSRSMLRQHASYWREKYGHTTIDFGVAPEKLECCENGEVTIINTMEKLKSVRGFLVSFPLEFMREEDLRPVILESEFYASPQVFH